MDGRNTEELPAERKVLFAAWIGQESVMANANETARQHMHQEAANKFQRIERHEFLLVAVFGIAPAEGDFAVCQTDQPVIGNCHTMGVAAQIIQHLFRAAERRFGIHDPFRFAAALQESLKVSRVVEFLKRSVELQCTRRVRFLEIAQEKAAE